MCQQIIEQLNEFLRIAKFSQTRVIRLISVVCFEDGKNPKRTQPATLDPLQTLRAGHLRRNHCDACLVFH